MSIWTQTLVLFGAQQKNVQDLVNDLNKDRCTEIVDVVQKNGAVFAACPVKGPCSACPEPLVIKISKEVLNPRHVGAQVSIHEALVLRDIYVALRALSGPWTTYKRCVLEYVNHVQGRSVSGALETVLVTKMVPRKSKDSVRNLQEHLRSGRCTAKDLVVSIIQVFMTLDLLQTLVPGFVHMDLLTAQIFLRRWPLSGPAVLPVNSESHFVLPIRRYWSVVGDFGTAVTTARPQAVFDYRFNEKPPGFVSPAQDVFRFFLDVHHCTRGTGLAGFADSLVHTLFGTHFNELVHAAQLHSKDTMYLPAHLASALPFNRYSNVLARLPIVNKFLR